MKTKITGGLAVALAISLAAFKSPNKNIKPGPAPYWFLVTNGIAKGSHAVPAVDATFIQQSVVPPNFSTVCTGGLNQCLSGFDAVQVDISNNILIDDNEISPYQISFQN